MYYGSEIVSSATLKTLTIKSRNDLRAFSDLVQCISLYVVYAMFRSFIYLLVLSRCLHYVVRQCQCSTTSHLAIESTFYIGWQVMPLLLRSCPHLETLVIKSLLHHVTNDCGDSCNCVSREEKGCSVMSCPVKRLEIRGFEGITRELEMIKHFLDYFSCLEEMEIYITDSPPKFQDTLLKELNQEMLMRYNDLSGRRSNVKCTVPCPALHNEVFVEECF